MAVNTAEDTSGDDTPGKLTPPRNGHVPFDGNAKSMQITKDINAHQLIEEVYGRLGDRSAFEVVLTGDPGEYTLYVLGDVDMRTVRGVLESHTPDAHYGLTEQDRRIGELRERLHGGEDLGSEDLNVLLRSML